MREKDWHEEVLRFWFEKLTPEDWFEVRAATDETIRDRFMELYRELKTAVPPEAQGEARAALAAIIVYDQFPRNMFRGQADAFLTDRLALQVSRNAIERGFDHGMSQAERQFLFMPFMHSEVLADQERSVMLFKTLGEDLTKYAVEHRDIVARFGRFPHRNRVLGREDTPAEREFLGQHKGFGQ